MPMPCPQPWPVTMKIGDAAAAETAAEPCSGSGVSRRGCAWYPTSMSTTLPRFPERYVHAERVASGGMGDIYTADDETLGRRVAIKLLADRYARDDAIRRRFTREALAAARLSGHPHIVTIF